MTHTTALWWGVGLMIVGAGAVLRLIYLERFGLWNDEAWLARTIVAPTVIDMLFPDWHAQSTPPLFLLLARGITHLLGTSDGMFRLLPALGGVASLPLIGLLTFQWSRNRTAALVATALWAFHPIALLYAHELKQYSTDAFVLLALLCLLEWYLHEKRSWRSFFLLLPIAWAGMALSHPAVFAMPVMALRLLMRRSALPRTRLNTEAALFVSGTGMFFALQYIFIILPEKAPWLVDYWNTDHQFLPLPITFVNVSILLQKLWEWAAYAFGQAIAWESAQRAGTILGSIGAVVGWLHLWRQRSAVAATVPLLLLLAVLSASMLRLYPFGGIRPSLFLIPVGLSLAAIGLTRLSGYVGRRGPLVLLGMLCLLLPWWNAQTAGIKSPWMIVEMQPLLERLHTLRTPSDALLVHQTARHMYYHYAEASLSDVRLVGAWHDLQPDAPAVALQKDLQQFCRTRPAAARAWLIVAGRSACCPEQLLLTIESAGAVIEVLQQNGAEAYLLQCSTTDTLFRTDGAPST